MADIRDLTGESYERDFPIIREYLLDLATTQRVDNMEGQVITHTFTTTSAEVIPHKLGRVPINFIVLDTNTAATVHRTASTNASISLVSSSSSLVLKFYVE